MSDEIEICDLELSARIGVSVEERACAQRVVAQIVAVPVRGFGGLMDRLERTTDYVGICAEVSRVAGAGERNLLETLAEEIAAALLDRFALRSVRVELRKFVVPSTRHVAVRLERHRAAG